MQRRTPRARPLATILLAILSAVSPSSATPTTTVWAPATPAVQGFLVPHLSYDTYFWKGPVAGTAGSPLYPVDTGLTMGVLPLQKLNLEVGFDLLLPSEDPLYLNAKMALPEDTLFGGQPGLALGMFGAGTERSGATGRTDYDILYGVAGTTLPGVGGSLGLGAYYALNEDLFTLPNGNTHRSGLLAAITAPDIVIGRSWLQKVVLAADVQTGHNSFGAVGVATSLYFTSALSVLTGPVRFFESSVQPGGSRWLWTVQLDVDLDLNTESPAPAAAKTAPPAPLLRATAAAVPAPTPPAPTPGPTSTVPAPEPLPTPTVAVETPTSPPPPAAEPARTVRVRLTTRPRGVRVYRVSDNELLGKTPLVVTLPAGNEPVGLRLRKKAYREGVHWITPDADKASRVTLRRARRSSRNPPAEPPPAPR